MRSGIFERILHAKSRDEIGSEVFFVLSSTILSQEALDIWTLEGWNGRRRRRALLDLPPIPQVTSLEQSLIPEYSRNLIDAQSEAAAWRRLLRSYYPLCLPCCAISSRESGESEREVFQLVHIPTI
jgi:hypothetical protein